METGIITAESVNVNGIEERYYNRLEMAKNIIIESPQDVEKADSILVGLSADISAAKLALKPMRDSTTAAWKAGTELEGRIVKPLEEAKKLLAGRRGEAVARIKQAAAEEQAALLDEGNFDEIVPFPVIASSGVSSREVFSVDVFDIKDLVKAAALDPRFLAFLTFDQSALNKEAATHKENFNVPGCKLIRGFSSTVHTKAKPYGSEFRNKA